MTANTLPLVISSLAWEKVSKRITRDSCVELNCSQNSLDVVELSLSTMPTGSSSGSPFPKKVRKNTQQNATTPTDPTM